MPLKNPEHFRNGPRHALVTTCPCWYPVWLKVDDGVVIPDGSSYSGVTALLVGEINESKERNEKSWHVPPNVRVAGASGVGDIL